MLPVLTAGEMRDIDRATIETLGIPGAVLMERAGLVVAHQAVALLNDQASHGKQKSVCILCGKGNNGGDGFVVARELHNHGYSVQTLVFAAKSSLQGDAHTNRLVAEKLGIGVTYQPTTRALSATLSNADLVVDALLGTGFTGPVRGPLATVIARVNAAGAPVLSIDVPSGLHADTGQTSGACVRATATVTIGAYKRGLLLHPGRELAGAVTVADIGIPPSIFAAHPAGRHPAGCHLPEADDIRALLPSLRPTLHKSAAGKLLVIAGSRGLTGAAALTALASLRIGAGLTVLGAPESCIDSLAAKLTEVMMLPLPETTDGALSTEARSAILERVTWADAVAIGPGLGRSESTQALVRDLSGVIRRPLIVDADALFALFPEKKRHMRASVILTPHEGEFSRMTGVGTADIQADRIGAAQSAARSLGVTMVLKGAPTIVARADGGVTMNPTGNPGLATAGSGDVLTGVIAGLAAQGLDPAAAALAGVWLHGRAGDLAAAEKGPRGMIAGDVLERLPEALQEVG